MLLSLGLKHRTRLAKAQKKIGKQRRRRSSRIFDHKIHQKNKPQHYGIHPRYIFTKIDQHTLYRHSTRKQTPSASQLLATKHPLEATKERPGPAPHTAGSWQRVARTLDAARRKGQPQTYATKTYEIPHGADNLCNQTTIKS